MQEKIVVIGGGASGLMAAIFAAQQGAKVTVLESGVKIGRKLLATGNGRCNLTNKNIEMRHYHGDVGQFAGVLEDFPSSRIVQTFEKFGLLCRTEGEGRIYPYNVQAAAVLDSLQLALDKQGVQVVCGFPVATLEKHGAVFRAVSPNGEMVYADKAILATGGKASPKLGSNGSGLELAKRLGHEITPLVPALVGVKTHAHRAKPLKGMRSYALASLWIGGQKTGEETGEVQFTEYGLSGICIFQFSRHINMAFQKNPTCPVEISLDLMPEYREEWIAKKIAGHASQYPGSPLSGLLSGLINRRVGEEIVRQTFENPHKKPASVCRYLQAQELAHRLKHFSFPILGSASWDCAQVTAGGVSGKQIHAQTMESKCCPGLYFAGEILNMDGDCGGFNLHWAWASGMLAGRSAAGARQKKTKQGGKSS